MGLPPVIIHFRIFHGIFQYKNNQSHGATPSHHPFSDFPWISNIKIIRVIGLPPVNLIIFTLENPMENPKMDDDWG